MKYRIENKNRTSQINDDRAVYRNMTPQERIDLVEQLRIESGKFLYEYPARLRRIIKIIRKKQC
jgi:hypothetical protein